jgi:dipeptidyl aminopeptidase/acylaminoacyl peptidase
VIFHGDDDAVVPLDQSLALDSVLAERGVPHQLIVLEGQRHGFGLIAGGRDLSQEIDEFLSAIWGRTRKKSSTDEKDQNGIR